MSAPPPFDVGLFQNLRTGYYPIQIRMLPHVVIAAVWWLVSGPLFFAAAVAAQNIWVWYLGPTVTALAYGFWRFGIFVRKIFYAHKLTYLVSTLRFEEDEYAQPMFVQDHWTSLPDGFGVPGMHATRCFVHIPQTRGSRFWRPAVQPAHEIVFSHEGTHDEVFRPHKGTVGYEDIALDVDNSIVISAVLYRAKWYLARDGARIPVMQIVDSAYAAKQIQTAAGVRIKGLSAAELENLTYGVEAAKTLQLEKDLGDKAEELERLKENAPQSFQTAMDETDWYEQWKKRMGQAPGQHSTLHWFASKPGVYVTVTAVIGFFALAILAGLHLIR